MGKNDPVFVDITYKHGLNGSSDEAVVKEVELAFEDLGIKLERTFPEHALGPDKPPRPIVAYDPSIVSAMIDATHSVGQFVAIGMAAHIGGKIVDAVINRINKLKNSSASEESKQLRKIEAKLSKTGVTWRVSVWDDGILIITIEWDEEDAGGSEQNQSAN